MADGIRVRMRVDGIQETLRAFRDLPANANRELRVMSLRVSTRMANRIAIAARASSAQSRLVAPTVKAVRDRAPAVQAGSSRRVGRNRKPAHKVLFGANFGAKTLRQFRPHTGGAGSTDYWFFRTVEANERYIADEWNAGADRILRAWGGGA